MSVGRQKLRILCAVLATLLLAQPATADVRCVQEFLAGTSFDPGPIDGLWGRKTEQAATGLLEQTGMSVSGGVTKSNAEAICAFFYGPDQDEMLRLGRYRVYTINIDSDDLSALTGKRVLDFSDVDVATTVSFEQCRFTVGRKTRSDGRIETLASGLLSIDRGNIVFGQHSWSTGGLADETYLHNEARLVVDKGGKVHGRMPYFHMFEVAGQIVEPPLDVELPGTYDPAGVFPVGINRFPVTYSADGFLDIYACTGGSTPVERPKFPGVDIASEAAFDLCYFRFERKQKKGGRIEALASGTLSIEDGYVTFGKHEWFVRGLADETYLSGVVLAVDQTGRIHGRTPFFHLFANAQHPKEPPIMVNLPLGFEPGSNFPIGTTTFKADHNQDGQLVISYCTGNQ